MILVRDGFCAVDVILVELLKSDPSARLSMPVSSASPLCLCGHRLPLLLAFDRWLGVERKCGLGRGIS